MAQDIYTHCPSYETESFFVRLVEPGDAGSLLLCYADSQARRFFNSDNCSYGFAYDTLTEMQTGISRWLEEYQNRCFVRFAVVEKKLQKAIGTIEIFHKPDLDEGGRRYGILRLDLAAAWEKEGQIRELLALAKQEFFAAFDITHILTKAVPEARERIAALQANGFQPVGGNPGFPHKDYWIFDGAAYIR